MSEAARLDDGFKGSERASNMQRTPTAALAAAVLLAAAVGGCATEPKATAQLVRASTLVSEAEKDQAQRFAAADLQRARDELRGNTFSEAALSRKSAIRR